jgi:hypothetical protein
MHIQYRPYAACFREQRLLGLDQTRRHDLLDEAEATKGTMEGAKNLSALESETQKIAKRILAHRVGWGEWINHFFRSGSVLDAKAQDVILKAADDHIRTETNLAVSRLWGVFRQGKRRPDEGDEKGRRQD